MLSTFFDEIAKGLSGAWARAAAPALAFWTAGLLAYAQRSGWSQVEALAAGLGLIPPAKDAVVATGSLLLQAAIIFAGVVIVFASAALAKWLTLPLLRLLEGYWPDWFFPGWRKRKAEGWRAERKRKRRSISPLLPKAKQNKLSAEELRTFNRLDRALSQMPVDGRRAMPTRLGNILRAAEEYPLRVYGLEIHSTWPHLWSLLPEGVQGDLNRSRAALDEQVRLIIWGLAALVWTVFSPWALLGLLVAAASYARLFQAARVYGDLLRAAYGLYRFALYDQTRWPLPPDPDAEEVYGKALSKHLYRGLGSKLPLTPGEPFFRHPKKDG